MKIKILGAHQHLNQQPTYDAQGRPTGATENPLLEVIAIPLGSDPQHSPARYSIQFCPIEDAVLLKLRPGAVIELAELGCAAGETDNAAYAKAAEAAEEAKAAVESVKPEGAKP